MQFKVNKLVVGAFDIIVLQVGPLLLPLILLSPSLGHLLNFPLIALCSLNLGPPLDLLPAIVSLGWTKWLEGLLSIGLPPITGPFGYLST